MRVLAWLIALLMVGEPVAADVMIVKQDAQSGAEPLIGRQAHFMAVKDALSRLGVKYDVYDATNDAGINTENVRNGRYLVNGVVKQYDAVILINSSANARCRADSMMMVNRLPTVPIANFNYNGGVIINNSGVDTTGITAGDLVLSTGSNTISSADGTFRFRVNFSQCAATNGSNVSGGFWNRWAINYNQSHQYAESCAKPCVDCDSIGASRDSCILCARLNKHVTGAKPFIFVNDSDYPEYTQSPEVVLGAIAWLDSASGGAVLRRAKLPILVGIVVRQAGVRSQRYLSGGGDAADSVNIKASIDSLASLAVPITVTMNVAGSADSTTQDYNWWLRADPYIHYAPEPMVNLRDTTTTGGNASSTVLADVAGRFRKRTAIGDGSLAGKDTSYCSLTAKALTTLQAKVGAYRIDHTFFPPDDDWLPADWTRSGVDSLVSALAQAGYTGVAVNTRTTYSNPTTPGLTNPWSAYARSRNLKVRYGTAANSRFRVLATPGFLDSGSVRWDNGVGSIYVNQYLTMKRGELFWRGLVFGRQLNVLTNLTGNTVKTINGGSIPDSLDSPCQLYTIHAGDLGSGNRSDASTRPLRPGWWQVKDVVNAAKAINAIAGKQIIQFVWAEQVEAR